MLVFSYLTYLLLIHPQVRHNGLHSAYENSIPPLSNLEARDGKGNMACTSTQLRGKAVSQLKNSRFPNSSSGSYYA